MSSLPRDFPKEEKSNLMLKVFVVVGVFVVDVDIDVVLVVVDEMTVVGSVGWNKEIGMAELTGP